jgi:hypothetical protein
MFHSNYVRAIVAFVAIGVFPLVFLNIRGISVGGGPDHASAGAWSHGWPLTLILRSPVVAPFPVSTHQLSPASGPWPIDGAAWLNRAFPDRLVVSILVWCALLYGSAISASRSRFSRTGHIQFSSRTLLLVTACTAVFLAFHLRFNTFSFGRIAEIPLWAMSLNGYLAILDSVALRMAAYRRTRTCA